LKQVFNFAVFCNKFVYPFAIGYLIKTLLSATKRWTSIYISKSFFMTSYSCEKKIKKNREYVEKLLQQVVKSPSIDRICSPSVMFFFFPRVYFLGVMDLIVFQSSINSLPGKKVTQIRGR